MKRKYNFIFLILTCVFFTLIGGIDEVNASNSTPLVKSTYTNDDGTEIFIQFDQNLKQDILPDKSQFKIYAGYNLIINDTISYSALDTVKITTSQSPLKANQSLSLTISANQVANELGIFNEMIYDTSIENKVTPYTVTMAVYHNNQEINAEDLIFFEDEFNSDNITIDLQLTVTDNQGQRVNNHVVDIVKTLASGNTGAYMTAATDVNGIVQFQDIVLDSSSKGSRTLFQWIRMENVPDQAMFLVPKDYAFLEVSYNDAFGTRNISPLNQEYEKMSLFDFISSGLKEYFVLPLETTQLHIRITKDYTDYRKELLYKLPVLLESNKVNSYSIDNRSFQYPTGFTILENNTYAVDPEINRIDTVKVVDANNPIESFSFSPYITPTKNIEFWISDSAAYDNMNFIFIGTMDDGSYMHMVDGVNRGVVSSIDYTVKKKIYEDLDYTYGFGDWVYNDIFVNFHDSSTQAYMGQGYVRMPTGKLYDLTNSNSSISAKPVSSTYLYGSGFNNKYYFYYFTNPIPENSLIPVESEVGGDLTIQVEQAKILSGDVQNFIFKANDGTELYKILEYATGYPEQNVEIDIKQNGQVIDTTSGKTWAIPQQLSEGTYTAELKNTYGFPVDTSKKSVTFDVYTPSQIVSAHTNEDGSTVSIQFDQILRDESYQVSNFQLNGTDVLITEAKRDSANNKIIHLSLDQTLEKFDILTINIDEDVIYMDNGLPFKGATQVAITNNTLSKNVSLKQLSINVGTLSPSFVPEIINYTSRVDHDVSNLTVTAEVYDANASVSIKGNIGSTQTVNLNEGVNSIKIIVTAEDGVTNKTYTIDVTREQQEPNINSTDLKNIVLSNGILNPSFTPSTTSYTADVDYNIASLTVTAEVYDANASVSIKGNIGSTQTVNLNEGSNIIPIVVTASDGISTKTYTVDVTRLHRDNDYNHYYGNDEDEIFNNPLSKEITVDIESGRDGTTVSKITIKRTTWTDGNIVDEVILTAESAKEAIKNLRNKGGDTARIIIPDSEDKVSEVNVSIPQEALEQLKEGNINLDIQTENAKITIPDSTLSKFNRDIYFRVVPIKETNEIERIKERAKKEKIVRDIAKDNSIKVSGRSAEIETNMQSQPIMITLPIREEDLPKDSEERQRYLNGLFIFIEHSDDTKDLIKGTIVTYEDGTMGVQFEIDKFSTFTIVYIEDQEEDEAHDAYINGYLDGTFKPNQSLTRAEMATLLARNLSEEVHDEVMYVDLDSKHWAYSYIQETVMSGLMNGYPDGSFKPDQTITRAEMAAIAFRWKNLQNVQGHKLFKDTTNHWAEDIISALVQEGIMNGYPNSIFKPDHSLNRGEAVAVMNKVLKRGPLKGLSTQTWPDVSPSHWAFEDIEEASMSHRFTLENGIETFIEKIK